MKFGNVGAIASQVRKSKSHSIIANEDIELSEKELRNDNHKTEKLAKSLTNDTRSLVMYRVPVFIWGTGILIVLLSLYLFYNLIWGFEGKVFKNQSGSWWQYLIAFIIMAIGIVFLISIKREKLVLNKQNDEILLCYRNILCQQKIAEQKLSRLSNLRIVKRGMDSIQNQTIHYKIIFSFRDGTYFEVLEGRDERKIKKQYIEIATYCNYEFQEIQIIDETIFSR